MSSYHQTYAGAAAASEAGNSDPAAAGGAAMGEGDEDAGDALEFSGVKPET